MPFVETTVSDMGPIGPYGDTMLVTMVAKKVWFDRFDGGWECGVLVEGVLKIIWICDRFSVLYLARQ